ncbi:hypothetical protein P3H78_14825 [Streptomyces sp. K1PA1]|uniref:Uncharacterized protein n=1 Tax=Streptomyces tropicalis TaxID=3034234 RepID=A0ABT6A5G3_9ACTN|nr:hypothetical protein [Streptomyces tropicalis]MDF3299880.1 hypothetical protein [Streptomyces tropicalis]
MSDPPSRTARRPPSTRSASQPPGSPARKLRDMYAAKTAVADCGAMPWPPRAGDAVR